MELKSGRSRDSRGPQEQKMDGPRPARPHNFRRLYAQQAQQT